MPSVFTFGVELEIALAWRIPPGTPILSTDNQMDVIQGVLVRRLISHGVDAERSQELEEYGKWQVHHDFSIHLDIWQLIRDLWGATVCPNSDMLKEEYQDQDGNRYAVANIELSSPIYKLDDNWTQDLTAVVAAVTSGEYRSRTDHSCGLHVHVGKGAGYEFPFEFMKKMSIVTTLLEEELDKMHPLYRREDNMYSASSLHESPSLKGLSRTEIFEIIRAAQDECDFTDVVQRNELGVMKSFKYNYLGALGTIEFRQHRGTLEVEEIEKWVRFVVGVTANVENASWEELRNTLLNRKWKTRCLTLLGIDRIEEYSRGDKDVPCPKFG